MNHPNQASTTSAGAAAADSTASTDAAEPTTLHVVILIRAARFALGHLAATPGALALLAQTGFSAAALIHRHVHGDWGDCCTEDAKLNEFSLSCGQRLLSVYRLVDAAKLAEIPRNKRSSLPTLWIITEADRSVTTLLLPQEY